MNLFFNSLLATAAVTSLAGSVDAATISDVNIFNTGTQAATVAASSSYNLGAFPLSGVDDLSGNANQNQYFFEDGGVDNLLSLSNFAAPSGIDTLRFYDTQEYETSRNPDSVTIYTSSVNQTSLTPANYTLLGTYALPKGANSYYTSGLDSTGGTGNYGFYDDLSGLGISSSTQSILFDFGHTGNIGSGTSEIQGFAGVPEPSTYALLLGGLVALGFMVRRKSVSVQA